MRSTRLPKMVALLTKRGCTALEASKLLFCTLRSARVLIQNLRQEGSVYISAYKKTSDNGWSAVYRYGIGVDADKPAPVPTKDRVLKHRERETIEEKEFRLARERSKHWKIKRDPLTAAFYGDVRPSIDD